MEKTFSSGRVHCSCFIVVMASLNWEGGSGIGSIALCNGYTVGVMTLSRMVVRASIDCVYLL